MKQYLPILYIVFGFGFGIIFGAVLCKLEFGSEIEECEIAIDELKDELLTCDISFNNPPVVVTEDYNWSLEMGKEIARRAEQYEMCGSVLNQTHFGITGIYYHDKYYCVWIDSRTYNETVTTEHHEVCHNLIFKDEEHYCGG